MPEKNVPYDVFMIRIIEGYYLAGAKDKAASLTKRLADVYKERYAYFNSFRGSKLVKRVETNINEAYQVVGYCQQVANMYGDKATSDEIQKIMSGMQQPM